MTANSSCGSSALQTAAITVNTTPTVSYIQSPSTVCINSAPITLSPGNPAGGTYLGAGVIGNSFNPSVAGAGNQNIIYSFTDVNNCSASSSQFIYVDLCTSILTGETNEIIIYPNPVTDLVYISNPNNDFFHLQLFDVTGNLILENQSIESSVKLDLNPISKGMYILKLSSDNQTIFHKIIKL